MKLASVIVAISLTVFARDTRKVTEPVIPPTCSVVESHKSAPDDANLDTGRIQAAIDGCAAGKAVELKGGAFVSGPLQLRSGVTLLIDRGAVLYASRNPRDFDGYSNAGPDQRCGTVDKRGRGCRPLISGESVENAAVMGDGVIDGRGGEKLIGQNDSWWDLAQEAKVKNENQNCPRLIVISHAKNFTLYKIALKNSPNFHVTFNGDGFTAWGVVIDSPKTSRNTDGIDPVNATNVTITHCFIHSGDDQVAIKAGGNGGPSGHMTISHNRFYTGHGMSIGSETDGGASAIRVSDLSIDGADNGLRIKSNETRGGPVNDIVYEDVCIQNTKNPIYMDSNYTATVDKVRGKYPVFTGIVLRDVRVLTPGKITLDGFDAAHRLEMTFDGVTLTDPSIVAHHAVLTLGPGPVSFTPSGDDVRVTGKPGIAKAKSCAGMFEAMPRR